MKKPKYHVRIRTYHEGYARVWLMRGESPLLFGQLPSSADAEELANAVGLLVERETCPYPDAEKRPHQNPAEIAFP